MRIPIVVAGMVATGLVAGGVLVLAAEAETTSSPTPPASAPLRTVSVEGVATALVDPAASSEAANAAYRQAMAAAIADGHAKAQFLAEKAGATIGQAQSIGESGGYVQCPEGVEYEGAQPDFGYGRGPVLAAVPTATARRATPKVHRARPPAKRHKRHSAKQAVAASCMVSTQVALMYQLG